MSYRQPSGSRASSRRPRVGIVVLTLLLGACNGASPAVQSTPSPSPVPTAWDTVLDRMGEGGRVDLETAMQAFSLAVAPLPGVELPDGTPGGMFEATLAVDWLVDHLEELTPEQRAAAEPWITPPPLPAGRTGSAVGTVVEAAFTRDNAALESAYLALLNEEAAQISTLLGGVALELPTSVSLNTVPAGPQGSNGRAYAYTRALDANGGKVGKAVRCHVFIDPRGQGTSGVDLEMIMAHEAFHCFQAQAYKSVTALLAAPKWLIEGQATWVGGVVGGSSETLAPIWDRYFLSPERSLFERAYDAVGFYSQLDTSGQPAEDVLLDMLGELSSEDAFDLAIGPVETAFLDSWSASLFREPSLGAAWDASGPGVTPTRSPRTATVVSNGSTPAFIAFKFANRAYDVTSTADIVTFETEDGHGRIAITGAGEWALGGAPNLCTKPGGCACPAGMAYSGPPTTPSPPQFELAVTGGAEGTSGLIVGHALDEFCKPGTVCSIGIPAGEYTGTLAYATTGPNLTHDGSGQIWFKVDAREAMTGSWDLAYVVEVMGEEGTGAVPDGVVRGTPRELRLSGTNVVHVRGRSDSVPWLDMGLTVQPVCDGHVVASWERTVNGTRQQVVVDAVPAP